jgi:DNA-binding winged helix-turn-helix (wHTH) protein
MAIRTAGAGSQAKPDSIRVRFDAFELDEANASLRRDGHAIPLAPTPFAVLCALVRKRGSLLTSDALLDEVWGHQYVSDSVLRTAISELRTALADDARQPRFIQTVSRRGYRFIANTIDTAAAHVHTNVSVVQSHHDASFIGRAEALSRLHRAWDSACSGKREVVWVAGEAGIGKTTLIEHFIATLGDVTCARGQCVEHYGTGEPYLPVLEALSDLCRTDSTLVPLLRAVAPTWLLQLPWFTTAEERDVLRRELAGVGPDRMLREIGALLDRSGDRLPLLLVTEDLHWSDRATIQLIDYVARRRGNARLMWLASFRLADVVTLEHPLNRLRRELRMHDLCDEIVLDPFSESEVAEYVVHRAPSMAADEAFVRALHDRTDGMPLFVASILGEMNARAAQADGAAAAKQVAKIAVPQNLAAIIEHYIARLEIDQRTLLAAAAVCGVDFRVDAVAAALEWDGGKVNDTCAELVRDQLWLVPPSGDVSEQPGRLLPLRFDCPRAPSALPRRAWSPVVAYA